MSNSNTRAWVDTVTDLNQYKPSQEELEQRKLARKSNNKLLAKVTIIRFLGEVEELVCWRSVNVKGMYPYRWHYRTDG